MSKEKVLEILKKYDKPMRPSDIAKETGLDSAQVSQIIKELKNEGKIISPKRCFYSIKK